MDAERDDFGENLGLGWDDRPPLTPQEKLDVIYETQILIWLGQLSGQDSPEAE